MKKLNLVAEAVQNINENGYSLFEFDEVEELEAVKAMLKSMNISFEVNGYMIQNYDGDERPVREIWLKNS